MAMYATPSNLAGYLQQDLDTYSATQALELATDTFVAAADTAWHAVTKTWTTAGGPGTEITLPYRPVTAVLQVRLNGVVITGWTLRNNALYRSAGFGTYGAFPPDEVQIDLTYGDLSAVPGNVKLGVLEIAAGLYENSSGIQSETIDDYTVRYSGTPISPGRPWRDVAADYRGISVA